MNDDFIRIVMIGAPGVGKSSIVERFTDGTFGEGYEPTEEARCRLVTIVVDDKPFNVRIMDIPSLPAFPANTIEEWSLYGNYGLFTCQAYVLVYDANGPTDESFNYIRRIQQQILRVRSSIPTPKTLHDAAVEEVKIGAELPINCNVEGQSIFRGQERKSRSKKAAKLFTSESNAKRSGQKKSHANRFEEPTDSTEDDDLDCLVANKNLTVGNVGVNNDMFGQCHSISSSNNYFEDDSIHLAKSHRRLNPRKDHSKNPIFSKTRLNLSQPKMSMGQCVLKMFKCERNEKIKSKIRNPFSKQFQGNGSKWDYGDSSNSILTQFHRRNQPSSDARKFAQDDEEEESRAFLDPNLSDQNYTCNVPGSLGDDNNLSCQDTDQENTEVPKFSNTYSDESTNIDNRNRSIVKLFNDGCCNGDKHSETGLKRVEGLNDNINDKKNAEMLFGESDINIRSNLTDSQKNLNSKLRCLESQGPQKYLKKAKPVNRINLVRELPLNKHSGNPARTNSVKELLFSKPKYVRQKVLTEKGFTRRRSINKYSDAPLATNETLNSVLSPIYSPSTNQLGRPQTGNTEEKKILNEYLNESLRNRQTTTRQRKPYANIRQRSMAKPFTNNSTTNLLLKPPTFDTRSPSVSRKSTNSNENSFDPNSWNISNEKVTKLSRRTFKNILKKPESIMTRSPCSSFKTKLFFKRPSNILALPNVPLLSPTMTPSNKISRILSLNERGNVGNKIRRNSSVSSATSPTKKSPTNKYIHSSTNIRENSQLNQSKPAMPYDKSTFGIKHKFSPVSMIPYLSLSKGESISKSYYQGVGTSFVIIVVANKSDIGSDYFLGRKNGLGTKTGGFIGADNLLKFINKNGKFHDQYAKLTRPLLRTQQEPEYGDRKSSPSIPAPSYNDYFATSLNLDGVNSQYYKNDKFSYFTPGLSLTSKIFPSPKSSMTPLTSNRGADNSIYAAKESISTLFKSGADLKQFNHFDYNLGCLDIPKTISNSRQSTRPNLKNHFNRFDYSIAVSQKSKYSSYEPKWPKYDDSSLVNLPMVPYRTNKSSNSTTTMGYRATIDSKIAADAIPHQYDKVVKQKSKDNRHWYPTEEILDLSLDGRNEIDEKANAKTKKFPGTTAKGIKQFIKKNWKYPFIENCSAKNDTQITLIFAEVIKAVIKSGIAYTNEDYSDSINIMVTPSLSSALSPNNAFKGGGDKRNNYFRLPNSSLGSIKKYKTNQF